MSSDISHYTKRVAQYPPEGLSKPQQAAAHEVGVDWWPWEI